MLTRAGRNAGPFYFIIMEKQLIPQSKIDEASSDYTEEHYGKRQVDIYIHESFEAGVQFALNEIEPLICEFIEEVVGDGWILRVDGWQNVVDFKISEIERRTTQQLLEEFIKNK